MFLKVDRLSVLFPPLCRASCLQILFLVVSLFSVFCIPAVYGAERSPAVTSRSEVADGQARPDEKLVLQLPWLHQFEFAGFYAAIDKGYYRQEGLSVELREAHPDMSVIDEVVSGRADYGIGNADLLASWGRGAPVVLIANLFKHSPLVVLARQDSGIRQPRDLIGKRLMTMPLDLNSAEISYMLYQGQVRPEQLDQVPHSYGIDELVSGKVDAMTAYITNQPFELQSAGVPMVVIDPANYGADFYSNNLFTRQSEVQGHAERVAAFRRASLKGWRYALEHPAEIVDLIYVKYSQRKSRAALHFEAREVAKLIAREVYPLGSIDLQRLRRLQEVYLLSGALTDASDNLQPFIWQDKEGGTWSDLNVTERERTFMSEHPTWRVCSSPGWLPYEGTEDGRSVGIGPDLLRKATETLGVKVVDRVFPDWSQAMQGLKSRQCDLLSAAVPSDDRGLYINFTSSFIDVSNAIVTRDSQAYISDISELKGRAVGVLADGIHEALLAGHYPGIELKNYPSMDAALIALSKGEVDGFVDTVATSGYGIRLSGLKNLHIAGLFPYKSSISVGVRSDWPELPGLLQKAYASVPEGEFSETIRHWVQITAEPDAGVSSRMLWQAAGVVTLLMVIFLVFYSRLKRFNRALAVEVDQRRRAEQATLQLNDELISKNQQLERLSQTDALTGLSNRYHAEKILEEAMICCLSRHAPLSVMLLDIDHFKLVNDRYGHNAGDRVLKVFADTLSGQCDGRVTAGRWGGEEFLLILPERDLSEAARVAQKIRSRVASSLFPEVGYLTVSIGLAALKPEESLHQLIGRADAMLYQAKYSGRNCVMSDLAGTRV